MSYLKNTKVAAYMLIIASFTLLASTVNCMGCATLSHEKADKSTYREGFQRRSDGTNSPPINAFFRVDVLIESAPIDCHSKNKHFKKKDCDSLMSSLPTLRQEGSGSGLLIKTPHGPLVLTAAHVCTEDVPESYTHKGITVSILTATKIRLKSSVGKTTSGNIVKIDHDIDLCLMRPGKTYSDPVEISDTAPSLGDKVYAIAAPFGISGKNLALLFTGYYSGTQDNVHFYTIPTRPGSSGSVVLNESWEAIGMLHSAFRSIESIGLGTGYYDLKSFISGDLD